MVRRRCAFEMPGGLPCGAPPLRDSSLCYWHDPAKADDLADAQRLGGLRRKRERTIAAAYDFTGLGSVEAIQRILVIATTDVLGLENSIARARVLISAGLAAIKLLETGDLQARIELLEAARLSAHTDHPAGGLEGGLLGGP